MTTTSMRAGPRVSTIRTRLVVLVLGTLLPLLAFTALVLTMNARLEERATEERLMDTARALALPIDHELRAAESALRALATSHLFDPANLRAFYEKAREIGDLHGGWLVLLEPTGQPILNTARPFGAPLPWTGSLDIAGSGLWGPRPLISDRFVDSPPQRPTMAVGVPVVRPGSVDRQLYMALLPERFTDLLAGQRLAPGWTLSVLDRSGTVVARSPEPEAIGRPAPPELLDRMRQADEGWLRAASLEPSPVYYAFTRAARSGWTIALGIPEAEAYAGARRSLYLVLAAAAVVLVLGLGLAVVLGHQIAAPLVGLARAARSLRAGREAHAGPSAIAEVEDLRSALDDAADARERETAERQRRMAEESMRRSAEQALASERERGRLLDLAQSARAEAESANRMKDEFIATLSHELRTPLNAIVGWLSLLRTSVDAAQHAHALDVIERNVQAQTFLVRDLLDVSRIGQGGLNLELEWADLARVVTEGCETLRPSAEAKGVRLSCAAEIAPALIDAQRIQQVVWNLVTNALRFTPSGGRIDVTLERVATGWSRLRVRDTGQGIPSHLLPHIFERVHRGETDAARAGRGLGLGLTIVKHLVERHGGTVRAGSEGPGTGATFTVELPHSLPPANPAIRRPEADAQAPSEPADRASAPGCPESAYSRPS